jgi:hypothetical protein
VITPGARLDVSIERVWRIEDPPSDADRLDLPRIGHVIERPYRDPQPLGGFFSWKKRVGAVRGLFPAKSLDLVSQGCHLLPKVCQHLADLCR